MSSQLLISGAKFGLLGSGCFLGTAGRELGSLERFYEEIELRGQPNLWRGPSRERSRKCHPLNIIEFLLACLKNGSKSLNGQQARKSLEDAAAWY